MSACVPKVRNYGDFRQHVIPAIITCMLRGTPCDTWFTRNFYRGNICSVPFKSKEYPNLRLRMSGNLTKHLLGVSVGPLSEILSVNDT